MPVRTKEPSHKTTKPASLFVGLHSYTEKQANIFFGRDEEINHLTNLIKANPLTIVFGRSGTGKTSLLKAGVFPRLRKDYCLPFYIRLEFNDDSPDLVTQIKNVLSTAIDEYGFNVESYPSTETLWEYFHREPLWKSVTPILVLDQFEEIFTLAKRNTRFTTELDAFWEEIADVIENTIPEKLQEKFLQEKDTIGYNYKAQTTKTVFSFREEFLPEFEGIAVKIPSLKYSRFRLLPMNGHQAYEVITKTWKSNIHQAQAEKIVAFFTNEEDKQLPYELMTIEPSLLSQVCLLIDSKRIEEGRQVISDDFLKRYSKGFVLRSIYDETLDKSNAAVKSNGNGLAAPAKPMNEFVEEKLITNEGYRTKYTMTGQDEKYRPGIDVLKQKYFVRDEGKTVELTHDVLTPLIKHDREERRKELALIAAKKKAKKRAFAIVLISLLIAGVLWAFSVWKAHQAIVAINQTSDAENKKQKLDAQIKNDSTRLDSLKKEMAKTKPNDNAATENNSAVTDSLESELKSDTRQLDSLNQLYQEALKEKDALEDRIILRENRSNDFTRKSDSLISLNKALNQQLAQLKQKMAGDSINTARLKDWYKALKDGYADMMKEYDEYQRTHPEVVILPDDLLKTPLPRVQRKQR